MQDKDLNTIIGDLKKNSIFRMSLGSKELFHSNFLEYLWDLDEDHRSFINMINGFIDKPLPPPGSNYHFAREKKNFDICIFHLIEGKRKNKYGQKPIKEVFDLIIENKVKSIPYKEQLEEYITEVKKNNQDTPCQYILLSLSECFPDNDSIQSEEHDDARKDICGWHLIDYEQMAEAIADNYKNHCCFKPYIEDYCSFVKLLVSLKNCILTENIDNEPLFDEDAIEKLKEIRVHDLYIKLRASWFIMSLKRRLEKDDEQYADKVYVVHKYEDFNKDNVELDRSEGIFLNVDINQGNGQAAAWILNKPNKTKLGDTFEIVIQGKQYRHGIALARTTHFDKTNKHLRLNVLYKKILKSPDAVAFLNFDEPYSAERVFPEKEEEYFRGTKKKGEKEGIKKKGRFCCYDTSYLYRYEMIGDNVSINDLLNRMIKDIRIIYSKLPQIK